MDQSDRTQAARCKSIFWNLLSHLRDPHSDKVQIHHLYVELQETTRCDEHMPGFADVRETMFARLKKIDPTLRERIPKLKVSEADKDALQQNYAHYRHWLTEYVAAFIKPATISLSLSLSLLILQTCNVFAGMSSVSCWYTTQAATFTIM